MTDPSKTKARKPLRVLLVDDYADIRAILSLALSRRGCAVTTAESAEEALQIVEERMRRTGPDERPILALDLIILDIMLPDASGLELLRSLQREYAGLPPIMIISARSDPETIGDALRLSAADYLPKPIDLELFLHKVDSLLGEEERAPFHWARLREREEVTVGAFGTGATALSESGLIVELPRGTGPSRGEVVPLESPLLDRVGLPRGTHGRVVRVVRLGGQTMLELTFIGLSQRELAKIRRFSLSH